jgi:proline iminopeptidase
MGTLIKLTMRIALVHVALLIIGAGNYSYASIRYGGKSISSKDSIYSLENINLGGIRQTILVTGKDTSKPLLLIVHGGPGFNEMAMFLKYNSDLNNHYLMVNWDQRGAGFSYSPTISKQSMNPEQFVSDAHQLVGLLKKRFHRKKLFLLGHSWGTYIATRLASMYPDDFYAYIGIGQIVNMMDNEKVSLQFTLRKAKETRNKKAIAELSPIAQRYPSANADLKDLYTARKWLSYYGGAVWGYHDYSSIYNKVADGKNPLYDTLKSDKGTQFSMETMWPYLLKIDLSKTVKSLKIPVYFMLGKHDFNAPYTLAENYFKTLNAPYKKLILFEHSAHLPPFEEPNKFNRVMAIIAVRGLSAGR